VLAANCEPLVEPSQLDGMRLKTSVRAGEVLCAGVLEPRPPVARGEAVTVRYVGRTVALTTRGVAQADAGLGRPVMIRNPSSHQAFGAVVSGPGEVTIHD
jgi:flagella basal body P-ring formation protein FlgA